MQWVVAPELPEARQVTDEKSALDAWALVLESVTQAKIELSDPEAYTKKGRGPGMKPDLPKRLKEWLEKLHEVVKKIVRFLADAVSFAITAAWHSVSVTIEFAKPER